MICIRLALEQKEENINGINKISPEAAGYRGHGNPVPDRVRSSVCSWRKAGADADHGNAGTYRVFRISGSQPGGCK